MLLTAFIVLMVMIAISIPIAAALGVLGLIMNQIFAGMPLHLAIGEIAWSNSTEYLLIAIPLFVLLGEILLRAGITEKMYEGIVQWLSWLPGGLMHPTSAHRHSLRPHLVPALQRPPPSEP